MVAEEGVAEGGSDAVHGESDDHAAGQDLHDFGDSGAGMAAAAEGADDFGDFGGGGGAAAEGEDDFGDFGGGGGAAAEGEDDFDTFGGATQRAAASLPIAQPPAGQAHMIPASAFKSATQLQAPP